MITTLCGKIFDSDALTSTVIIECGGVGYSVAVTAPTIARLPMPQFAEDGVTLTGDTVRIFTYMAVREDGVSLYGFYTMEELDMFIILLSINGIGPKAGMAILSLLTPKKLFAAVANEDSKLIAKTPGVGAKTAARVVLELKDKLPKKFPQFIGSADGDEEAKPAVSPLKSTKLADAREALTTLGYSRSEVAASLKDIDESLPLDSIIKLALKALMK